MRLTIGNGHGIAAILDHAKHIPEEDAAQEEHDKKETELEEQDREISPSSTASLDRGNAKRQQRAEWWREVMAGTFSGNGDTLFDHPAIHAAVKEIEAYTEQGEKVLVFGRFTQPMRALVNLLNARAMLHALDNKAPWPQSKLHEDEIPAVEAAQRQLRNLGAAPGFSRQEIDQHLAKQYRQIENRRARLRGNLINWIRQGLCGRERTTRSDLRALLDAATGSENTELAPLLAHAIDELMEDRDHPEPAQCASAFVELMDALRDRDEGDANGDDKLDETEASDLWPVLEQRLRDEYGTQRGKFARLMNGETQHATRRMLQLAFNRDRSFPKVLVAQSLVGREGLNLHQACRIVVLLHPEWNPGVVEQQIGRVDRVSSRWARELEAYTGNPAAAPRIEIRPVVFTGTYDEYNWRVLRDRWDNLRAQLHGVIVPSRERSGTGGDAELIENLDKASPNFRPNQAHTR